MTDFLRGLAMDRARAEEEIKVLRKHIKWLSLRVQGLIDEQTKLKSDRRMYNKYYRLQRSFTQIIESNAHELKNRVSEMSKMTGKLSQEERNLKFTKGLERGKTPFQFVQLPAEIQEMIMKLVLFSSKCELGEDDRPNHFALFRTTEYFSQRSASIFYGQEPFVLSSGRDFEYESAFQYGNTAFTRNIRYLTLWIDIGPGLGTNLPYVLGRLKDCPELRTLHLLLMKMPGYFRGNDKRVEDLQSLTPERPDRLNTIVVSFQEEKWHGHAIQIRQILYDILKIV